MKSTASSTLVMSILFHIALRDLTEAQSQTQADKCSFAFETHYSVRETDPPSTEILRIASPAGVTWSMSISNKTLPMLNGQLDSYLALQKDSGHYLLTVNKTLDIEDVYDKLGVQLNTLVLRFTCQQPGRSSQSQDIFLEVAPVNEYFPEFLDSPYAVNVSEKESVGFMIINLGSVSRDRDVRPATGEIYAYTIEPYDYARFDGKPEDDGSDWFTMANAQTGRVEVAKKLDFEQLAYSNRTTLWLNVTVTDYSRNTNWTTVRVTVLDDDDLSPEFYVSSDCVPRPLKFPPCYITYKVRVLVNTTGKLDQVRPAPIFAHDRDTIDNPVTFQLKDSADTPGLASHLDLNETTGVLEVVRPFPELGVYSFIVVAKEVSKQGFTAQTTLQVDVHSHTYDPWSTAASVPAPTGHTWTGGGANSGGGANFGGGANPVGGANSGGGAGSKDGGGTKAGPGGSGDSQDSGSDSVDMVPLVGMGVLAVLVAVLVVALFVTCLKLRTQRLARVGSADASNSSRKSFVDDEELPSSSGEPSPGLQHKQQEAVLHNLPEPGDRGNKLPPLQPPAPNPDVFDGTRTFEDGVDTEFFTMRGKTKVPLQPSDNQTATSEAILVDDGEISP